MEACFVFEQEHLYIWSIIILSTFLEVFLCKISISNLNGLIFVGLIEPIEDLNRKGIVKF